MINGKVDLPELDEKEEEKLFKQIYEAAQDSLYKIVDRI